MPLITQGKTNWRYIFIVIILAVIVGGGILWCMMKPEVLPTEFPEIKMPEKVKDETADWKIYYTPYYSIEYPNTWFSTKDFNDTRVSYLDRVVITNKKIHPAALDFGVVDAISMAIEVNPPIPDLNVEQIIQKGFFVQEMTVNGYKAFKIMEPNTKYPSAYFAFKISTDKYSINLEGNYSATNQDEYFYIVELMISTIKIFEPDETADWKTYRNEEYGFEVKYPSDTWDIIQRNGTFIVFFREDAERYKKTLGEVNYFNLTSIIISPRKGFDGDINSFMQQVGGEVISREECIIPNGMTGICVTIDYLGHRGKISSILLKHDQFIFEFQEYIPSGSSQVAEKKTNINQIISTFRFLEKAKEIEQITSFKILKIEEKFLEETEREIAFLQNGNIWILSKDLKKKYKLVDEEKPIIKFAMSPDCKEIYWLNGKEIWKRDSTGEIKLLTKASEINIEAIKKRWEEVEWVKPEEIEKLEEGIVNFELSPDGKYIAFEEIEDYTSCCGGPPNIPVTWIWIIKSDGAEKVKIEKPSGVERNIIVFDKWFPDSKKILFHFRFADEATQGSPLFEVGLDGKNPKIYSGIKYYMLSGEEILDPSITLPVFGIDPVFSPDGTKIINIGSEGGIWLANVDGSEKKQILEGDFFGYPSEILNWSQDGNLLCVTSHKFLIFNKKGEIIFETEEISNRSNRVAFSLDNKYFAGAYRKEKTEIIFLVDFITKKRKEFELPEIKVPHGLIIVPQFFSKSGRLYYFIDPIDSTEEEFLPQFWVIDTNNWKNYKITDDVLQVKRIP